MKRKFVLIHSGGYCSIKKKTKQKTPWLTLKIIQKDTLLKIWRKKLERNLFIPFSDCHHFFPLSGSKLVITFSMVWLLGWVCGLYGNLESQMKHFCSPWKMSPLKFKIKNVITYCWPKFKNKLSLLYLSFNLAKNKKQRK